MGENHDYLALDWVKGEIEETLKQAQQSLEAYVENPEDSTRMRFCLTYLHQVYGTLQMVEFYGAALLAEEMEKLAQAILTGQVVRDEEAKELLMRGILQLPNYLESVKTGRRDHPVIVLPLLNDLRAARGESLLSETALFKPDLEGGLGKDPVRPQEQTVPDATILLKKIRQLYQFALVGLIRNQDLPTNIGYLMKALARLERLSQNGPMHQLWMVAGAMIEGIANNSIEMGTSVKMLLGLVDRQIKEIADADEFDHAREIPIDLLKNLLYYVAKSDADSPRIRAVREAYRLDDALPGDLHQERVSLAPNRDAMMSVVTAIGEELARCKEKLDIFVRSPNRNAEDLKEEIPTLKQIADTLAVLGMGMPRRVVLDQIDSIGRLVELGKAPNDSELMDIAGALLYVEATLNGMTTDGNTEAEAEEGVVSPDQLGRARDAVLRESRAGLETAKEGIIEYIASQWDKAHLENVPATLRAVKGGLEMVPLARPTELLACCIRYIEERLLSSSTAPDWRDMDTLADAITSVEYYLERLSDDDGDNEHILEIAEESVAALGYPLGAEPTPVAEPQPLDEVDEEAAKDAQTIDELEELSFEVDEQEDSQDESDFDVSDFNFETESVEVSAPESALEETTAEVIPFEPPVESTSENKEVAELEEEPSLDTPDIEVDDFSFDSDLVGATTSTATSHGHYDESASEEEASAEEVSEEPAMAAEPEEEEDDDLIDDEVIEIFVEEAGEVLETINEFFPNWKTNHNDEAALTEVRRAFHTLKGSGRMVGAGVVGELAWSIENMLNRVIDNTIQISAAVMQIIDAVLPVIPVLVEDFSAKRPASIDTAPLEAIANEISSGADIKDVYARIEASANASEEDEVAAESEVPELEVVEETQAAESAAAEDVEELELSDEELEAGAIDPVLLDIFRNEATSHLDTVSQFLDSAKGESQAFTAPVLRALHTLKGSANMAGFESVAKVVTPIEKLVKALHSADVSCDGTLHDFLSDVVKVISNGLDHLEQVGLTEMPDSEALLSRVAELQDRYLAHHNVLDEDQYVPKADPQLVKIFLAEGMDLIMDAENVLNDWQRNPVQGEKLDELRTELDKLSVSAKSALLPEVEELSRTLFECYDAASNGRFVPNESFFEIAHEAHENLIDSMDRLAAGQGPQPVNEIVMALKGCLEESIESEPALEIQEPEDAATEEVEEISFELEDTEEEAIELEVPEVEESSETVEELPEEPVAEVEELPEMSVSVEEESSAEEYSFAKDPELVEIFLEEATDIMDESAETLARWQDSNDRSEVMELQRGLHTLKGAARLAEIPEIGDLSHQLENIYEAVCESRLSASPDMFQLLHKCHDRLAAMVESLAQNGSCAAAPDLLAEIDAFTATPSVAVEEEETIEVDEEALSDADWDEEAGAAFESGSADQDYEVEEVALEVPAAGQGGGIDQSVSDKDPELVEIFLEEANDIVDNTANTLARWEDSGDRGAVEELQRDLHTLKGGARLAEIPEIGDLAHQLEFIYEAVAESRMSSSPAMVTLLNKCHDRLADMVENLTKNGTCAAAPDLLAEINAFVKSPGAPELPQGGMESTAETLEQPMVAPTKPTQVEQPVYESVLSGDEELDPEIIDIFLEESEELAEGIDNTIHEWKADPSNKEHMDELQRLLHTLKGGARLAGLTRLGDVSHDFETFLTEAVESRQTGREGFMEEVHKKHDQLMHLLEGLKTQVQNLTAGKPMPETITPVDMARQGGLDTVDTNVVPLPKRPAVAHAERLIEAQRKAMEQAAANPQPVQEQQQRRGPQEMVKVPAALLEELVNLAGETSITRGRIEQEVSDFSHIIEEMTMTIDRLKEQLRRLDIETEATILYRHEKEAGEYNQDFDPLEMDRYSALNQLSRSLSESSSDLLDLKDTLLDKTRDTETLLLQQSRVNTELQEGLMRTRMVPFSRLTPRLRRIVRQVGGELGKQVDLEVVNAEGEMDRTVLERMVAPLEHMLRNAVDHGIEMPDQRAAAGKPKVGRITLHLSREGGEVVLRLSDDGKGIHLDQVRKRAIERGLMKPDAKLSDNELLQFIFRAGFSTAASVTQISGRGVGMDVVHSEIKQLGGSLKIHSAQDKGSQFTVRLPFTVAVNRALMVRVGEDAYAIPLNHIEGIVRVSPFELETYYQEDAPAFNYAGQEYLMRYLGTFVHGVEKPNLAGETRPIPVLLVRGADQAVAIQVDALIGSREVVVKAVGPQLSSVAGISGATILGDGSVVIILDLVALIRAESVSRLAEAAQAEVVEEQRLEHEEKSTSEDEGRIMVMVVDDSVTVRKVTSRLLERHGMEVLTARDGVDAMNKLREYTPDIMLLDIEMPRMDGFEVASQVRHDERLKDLPIIMITSRTGEKHRERAYSIGVNQYMGKPFQEGELLASLEALLRLKKHQQSFSSY